MARKPVKFGSRKRYAEGGATDRYKDRYDRKIADIESDYAKAKARKTGRGLEVAEAKYNQRMADAKDDLAKWTGADRTQTRAAESAAERNLSMTRRFGASKPSVSMEDKPLVTPKGPSDADLAQIGKDTAATVKQGMSDAGNFGSAFRAARNAGDKTFTWRGKSYTTQMAGEGRSAARPAAPKAEAPKPAAPKPAAPKPAAPKPAAPKPAAPKAEAPKLTQSQRYLKYAADREAEAAQERAAEKGPAGQGSAAFARLKNLVGFGSDAATKQAAMYRRMAAQEDRRTAAIAEAKARDAARDKAAAAAKAKRNAEIIAAGEKPGASGYERSRAKFYRENPNAMKKGGAVKKYAKGGSVDGCAVRGKTRARKK